MKRIFALLLACVLLVGLLPTAALAATNVSEQTSSNDSESTAQKIYHDYQITGTLDCTLFGSDDMDYYKFEMKSGGNVTIKIKASSKDYNAGFRIDGPNGYVAGSADAGYSGGYYWKTLENYYLSAGTYYISVVGVGTFTYYLHLDAPNAKDESKVGLSLSDPYIARLNNTYSHTWTYDNQRDDTYYAQFTLTEPGIVELFCFAKSVSDEMNYTLYNEAGQKIWSSKTDICYSQNMSLFVGLDAGTYIYAAEIDFYLSRNETYHADFFVKFTPEENVAAEPNNSKQTAKEVEFGVDYVAVNGESPTTKDYWKINMEEDGRVLFYLPDYYKMTGNSSAITIYNNEGSKVRYTLKGNYLAADLTKGENYFIYGYISSKNSSNCSMEYRFRADLHECEYLENVISEPNCKYEGKKEVYCPTCGYEGTETIPTTAHDWAQYQVNKEPTATEDGEKVMCCTECGKKETVVIPAIGGGSVYNPFVDVPEGKFFYEPVLWAFFNGITTGKDATHFNPSGECTRAQVVTFLWRAAGEPTPSVSVNIFPDIANGKYYTNAVLWASSPEMLITTGFKDGTFGPNKTCTRAQIVTFLWRFAGCPTPSNMYNPFPDVDVNAYYGQAVLWAVENNITGGFKDGTFGPNKTCTRDQIVTFLYRYMVEGNGGSSQAPSVKKELTQDKIAIKLKIPRNGTMNSYAELQITNNSDSALTLPTFVGINGYLCTHYDEYVLEAGKTVKISYYRSILESDKYGKADMYLDNYSEGYIVMEWNGEQYYAEYGVNGIVEFYKGNVNGPA